MFLMKGLLFLVIFSDGSIPKRKLRCSWSSLSTCTLNFNKLFLYKYTKREWRKTHLLLIFLN
ncbi:hypothetical protein MANES_09G111650v8 [Manihot esculenta]|uniref:Uncharacterized protein n=1 Tax=Manihot esculenta TaxID=3983 RepID=A0ACB7H519_MANES|nr:hypothetical protein MANES_09G111650v8 [Manihot esculenta]